MDMALFPANRVTVDLLLEIHLCYYKARADWSLRSDLAHPVSFIHRAYGTGVKLLSRLDYALSDKFSMVIALALQCWTTGKGVETTFLSDGSSADTRLNEVNLGSWEFMAGFSFRL
jgi:hypothetical protein